MHLFRAENLTLKVSKQKKMPGLQGENVVAALGSPIKKSKLSLKFLQKKDTKRALDFSEPQPEEPKAVEQVEPEARWVSAVNVGLM